MVSFVFIFVVPLVVTVGAVLVPVIDLVDPDLGAIAAVEPVDWIAIVVVLLLVGAVGAVLVPVIDPAERYLIAVPAIERRLVVILIVVILVSGYDIDIPPELVISIHIQVVHGPAHRPGSFGELVADVR